MCKVKTMETRKQAGPPQKPRAATQDVVGADRSPERIRPKWRSHYNRLVELREHLLRHQADLSKDAIEEQPGFSTHMADAGTDTYDRDLALGMLSSQQDALYEIDEALNRIRNGSYAICELSGKPIEPSRLEAIPWTRFSLAAEKQLESQGGFKRARLGPRETVVRTSTKAPEES